MLNDEQYFSYNGGGYARPLKTWSDFSFAQYIQKPKKLQNIYIHKQKSRYFYKNQDNFRYFFIYKKPDTLRYAIFHEMFEIGIYIQK